ncbi:TetR/AcrR family transcriptional regulator [Streptomyces sp. NPDC000594]|uniref:TetR/AcrR family transcriptional regulator n=1 Tax=Streptomyces sp. NPDC000594 TaxID=3154261 RepID=UPI00332B2EE5
MARTRAALIRAAAEEFGRGGYAGTSVRRITQTAEVSTGALTFHFESKSDLADAVVSEALTVVEAAVADALAGVGTPLERLSAVVAGVLRAAHRSTAVRSAALLEQEHPQGEVRWSRVWHPVVLRLAEESRAVGELPPGVSPEEVSALAALFLRSAGVRPPHRDGGPEPLPPGPEAPAADLDRTLRLWDIARRGLLPAPCDDPPPREPATVPAPR